MNPKKSFDMHYKGLVPDLILNVPILLLGCTTVQGVYFLFDFECQPFLTTHVIKQISV